MTWLTGRLVTFDDDGGWSAPAGAIRIEDDRIAEVDASGEFRGDAIGGEDAWIFPGFIDAHVHLPQFDVIGCHGLPLLDWLQRHVFPAESRWADVDFASAMTDRVCDQWLSAGTTSVAAYATSHPKSAAAAIGVMSRRGVGGLVGPVLMNRFGPPALIDDPDRQIDGTAALLSRHPPGGRVSVAVTPRFAVSCDADMLAAAGRLAAEHDANIQTHLSETLVECDQVRELFGKGYVDVYDDAGLLTPRTILGHGIHLDDEDRSRLRQRGAIVAHCPTANDFLASGRMSLSDNRASDVRVALGSDIGAGFERSMVRVARAMLLTAAAADPERPPPAAIDGWRSITRDAADVLGWTDRGRLHVGATADVVVVRPTLDRAGITAGRSGRDADERLLSQMLWAWDDRWIEGVWTLGRRRYPQ